MKKNLVKMTVESVSISALLLLAACGTRASAPVEVTGSSQGHDSSESSEELNKIRNELESKNAENEQLKRAGAELKSQIEALNRAATADKESLAVAKKNADELQREIDTKTKRIAELVRAGGVDNSSEIIRLKSELAQKNGELSQSVEEAKKLQAKIDEQSKAIAVLKDALASKKIENEQLKGSVEELNGQIEALNLAAAADKVKLAQLADAEKKAAALQQDILSKNSRIAELEKTGGSNQAEINRLKSQVAQANAKLGELSKVVEEAKNLRAELEAKNGKIAELEKALEAARNKPAPVPAPAPAPVPAPAPNEDESTRYFARRILQNHCVSVLGLKSGKYFGEVLCTDAGKISFSEVTKGKYALESNQLTLVPVSSSCASMKSSQEIYQYAYLKGMNGELPQIKLTRIDGSFSGDAFTFVEISPEALQSLRDQSGQLQTGCFNDGKTDSFSSNQAGGVQ